MFNHVDTQLPSLSRETIDGVRYYDTPDSKLVSITSVISFFNRDTFVKWRKRVGEDKANEITRKATSRGTDMHTLTEYYLKNESLPVVKPLPNFLFKIAKPNLNKIDNIHTLEGSMYSKQLGVAGTVDCIAEYDGELAIIDFKTSAKPKPRAWIDGYFVQCAAYACMYYELTGIPVKKFVIIMACEDGDCVVYQEYDKMKYMNMLVSYIRNFLEFHLQLNGK
jgi:genome maintenance exonuclease 1